MMKLIVLCALAGLCAASAAQWVVIAAGSKSYGNYRHQADACHAYQIAKKNGIPESNIILMMQDDVANSPSNPIPGKLFNKPTNGTGVDVYAGCKVDYKGDIVTAQLFIDVITGNEAGVAGKGSDKVLKSTANDDVFINFVDHGGTGLIAFPNGPYLYADDLNNALKKMNANNMYKKLVFYMEACESGSMFNNLLPTDINVYATTAANPSESSWGTYCPPNDIVNGVNLNTCLGDLYSVNWMEDADSSDLTKESLQQQFEKVQKETDKSHVQEYGTMSFNDEPVADFLGSDSVPGLSLRDQQVINSADTSELARISAVDSRDIPLHLMYYNYLRAEDHHRSLLLNDLNTEVARRRAIDSFFIDLRVKVTGPRMIAIHNAVPRHFDCMRTANQAVEDHCFKYDDYSLKHTSVVVDMCELEGGNPARIVDAVSQLCSTRFASSA